MIIERVLNYSLRALGLKQADVSAYAQLAGTSLEEASEGLVNLGVSGRLIERYRNDNSQHTKWGGVTDINMKCLE